MNRRGFLTGLFRATATVAFLGVTRLSLVDDDLYLSEKSIGPIWIDMSKRVDDRGIAVLSRSHGKSDLHRQVIERGFFA